MQKRTCLHAQMLALVTSLKIPKVSIDFNACITFCVVPLSIMSSANTSNVKYAQIHRNNASSASPRLLSQMDHPYIAWLSPRCLLLLWVAPWYWMDSSTFTTYACWSGLLLAALATKHIPNHHILSFLMHVHKTSHQYKPFDGWTPLNDNRQCSYNMCTN